MKKNIWIKLASLALASALWLFVMWRGQTEVSVDVAAEFINIPAGLEIVEPDSIPPVALGVRGHERFLKNLTPENVSIFIDMKGAAEGRQTYAVRGENVRLPAPLKLINVYPPSMKVRLRRAAPE